MGTRFGGTILAGVVLTAILVALSALASSSEPTSAGFGPNDCRGRDWGPTATGTPWPTPPFTPYYTVDLCNDTASVADDLHITLSREAGNSAFFTDPLDCGEPTVALMDSPAAYTEVDIEWPEPCVSPGETVYLRFDATCSTPEPGCYQPIISCYNWTLAGTPLPSESWAPLNPGGLCENPTESPSPTASPSPTPTRTPGPGECPNRPNPPVTAQPTLYQSPPYYPPGTFLGTDRDVPFTIEVPFCNNSGVGASDLHIHFATAYSRVSVSANPTGCPDPEVRDDPGYLDEWDLDIDWGTACVDLADSVTLSISFFCGSPCGPPTVYCYTWTLDDVELESDGACPELPFVRLWGDIDCNNSAGYTDVTKVLQNVADLEIEQSAGCPRPGLPITVDGLPGTWADFDCDGQRTAKDALAILMRNLGLQTPAAGCPRISEQVEVVASN